MVQIHWTVSFANWAADSQLSGVRCVSAYLKDASEYVGAQIRRLQAVRFGSPSMAALRAIYLSQRDPATNLEVISCLLATYIIVRSNLLFERTGKKVVDVPSELCIYLERRNPVAELTNNIEEVSLRSACANLQLHNVLMSDDPYSIAFATLYRDLAVDGVDAVALMRTLLTVVRGRSVDVIGYFRAAGLITCHADLARFIAEFTGQLGDGSTTETRVIRSPEDYVHWVWQTFREDGSAKLTELVECSTTTQAIDALQALSGWGGSGFTAATAIHSLLDSDDEVGLLSWRRTDHSGTGVGPGPRAVIDCMIGRCGPSGKAEADAYYLEELNKISRRVAELVPAGRNDSFRRERANPRAVQFNLCKLLPCIQYILTGKTGQHARKEKASGASSASGAPMPGRSFKKVKQCFKKPRK